MSSDAKQVIEAMPNAFVPAKAGSAKAFIQLELTGEGGGEWVIDIADGKCEVREEVPEKADVKLTMDAGDFIQLTKGKLNAVQAFMAGKIKVAGNVGQVMPLMNWFDFG